MGTVGRVNINGIKESIRSILAGANTVGGSPIDLSEDLSTRIKNIYKVNPEKVMSIREANNLPGIAIHTARKVITPKTISQNLVNGLRQGVVTVTVTGLIWNPFTLTNSEDPADDDLELLMENIEKVLRSSPTLGDNAKWHFPTDVTYHSASFDEETHFRVAFMDIDVTTLY